MGTVYEVTHVRLDKKFALKVPHPEHTKSDRDKQRFFQEARFVSSLSHRNIVTIVDFGEDPGFGLFMVIEYLEGEPLAAALRKKEKMPLKRAFDLIQQVSEGLAYIHQRDIVHCDIKTHNIFMCSEMHGKQRRTLVKLLDFGLASYSQTKQNGIAAGTPAYMAPEVALGEAPQARADVYAVGVLCFELLTGSTPFKARNIDHIKKHLSEPAPLVSERLDEGIDPAIDRLVSRALEKDPLLRHRDMLAFLYELQTVMNMLGLEKRRRSPGLAHDDRSRALEERREFARATLDGLRIPVAVIDGEGRVALANSAFNRFILGGGSSAEGTALSDSRLPLYWKTMDEDLAGMSADTPITRLLEIHGVGIDVVRLRLWLEMSAQRGFYTLTIQLLLPGD